MILRSWLASVFGRLTTSTARSGRRNRRTGPSATPRLVELLEQRQLLTAPTFPNVNVNFNEAEQIFPYGVNSIAVGAVVAQVNVFDPDIAPNNYVKGNLQITAGNTDVDGNGVGAFTVNANDQIVVQDPRDIIFEMNPVFTLTVVATDAGGATGTGTVTINLVNAARDIPVVPQYPYSAIDYAPKAGDDASGVVPLGSVIIRDPGVNVLRVKENSVNGTIVGKVTAIDNDSNSVSSPLTYSLQGTIPGKDATHPAFSIDSFSGVVRVIDSSFLDYEARRGGSGVSNLGEGGLIFFGVSAFPDVILDLQVRATDVIGQASRTSQPGGGISDSHVYIRLLDVGETPPNVTNSTKSLNIDENKPAGTSVGYFDLQNGVPNFITAPIRIAKAGLDPSEPQQRHSFAIVGGNTNNAFAIDYTTGEVTVNNPVINYEALNVYSLQIQVTDDNVQADAIVAVGARTGAVQNVAPLSTVATLRIDVNDLNELTTIPSGQTFSIPENTVNGTIVGTVIANDPDTQKPNGKASLVYSITNGNTAIINGVSHDGIFAIDPATGVISVKNVTGLTNPEVLDFENQPTFGLTVLVVDRGDMATSANSTVIVNLTNVNEHKPSVQDGNATIAENRPLNDLVGQVIAAVGEPGNLITSFQIIAGNTSNAFAIDSAGRITVSNPAAIDFETNPQFVLTIKATDNGTPSLFATGMFTVNVTNLNEQIVMLDQTFSANENTPNGIIIGQIFTTDPDNTATFTQGKSFVINAGNTGGAFAIDDLGRISVTNSSQLNFESIPSFTLAVTVTDAGVPSTSASAFITINLVNVNDAPAIANQSFNVNEHSLAGTTVGTVQATDEDRPAQTLTYAITGGDPSGAFSINPATGAITVNDPGLIDYATQPKFTLTVKVTDSGTPALSSSATVTIFLLDVQEPQLADQTVSLPENSPNGTVVTTDAATNGVAPYTYSILSGNVGNAFVIDAATGKITVKDSTVLNFEAIKTFALKLLVVDSQATPLGDTATVTINLTNVNEAPALISLETTTLDYIENAVTPVTATVVAVDPDSNNAQSATIQITANYQIGQDTLVFTNTAKITKSWDAASGTLTLSGVDSFSNYRTAIRSVAYSNLSDNPNASKRTVQFKITDDGGLNSPFVTRDINVIPVNDPPALASIVTVLSYTEATGPKVINASVTVNDPDSPTLVGGVVTLKTFVAGEDVLGFLPNAATMGNIGIQSNVNGVLKLASSGGTATLLQWQAAFRAVTYTNTSGNPTTTNRTVTFVADDGASANRLSNSLTTTITINSVNNPPVLSGPANITYTENDPATAIDLNIAVSDVDNNTFPSGVVTLTNFVAGQDLLGFVNDGVTMGDIAVSTNAGGQLTLVSASGTATANQWQAAFAAVTYTNSSDNPNTILRNVTFTISDGAANSNPLASTINVVAVNDAPVLANSSTITYTENNPATAINSVITVNDVDNTTLSSAAIQITNFVAGEDVLGFANDGVTMGNIAILSNSGGLLTLTSSGGTASLTQWQSALRAVTYANSSGNPTTTSRNVTFQVNDGSSANSLSNVITSTINLTSVNTAPTLSGIELSALMYNEKSMRKVSSSIVVSDVDSANLLGASITITGNFQSNQDLLQFTDTLNITGSFDGSTGILTLAGLDTVANYQAALRSVSYVNSSSNPSTAKRTVSFTVTDDTNLNSNSVTRDINIIPINDPPVLSGIENTPLQYFENTPPNFSANNTTPVSLTIQATDVDSPNLLSATIQITGGTYLSNQDLLVFKDTLTIKGSWNAGAGTLTLSGSDTLANYTTALETVSYFNLQDNPSGATRTVTYIVTDDGGLPSNAITRDINVNPVNDPPVLSNADTTALNYTEDAVAKAILPNVFATDPDSNNLVGATIKISGNYNTPNGEDTLVFAPVGNITGSWDALNGVLTLTGVDSVSNYRSALRSVAFFNQHDGLSTAKRTVSYFVTDDGGLNSNTITRDINITTVNDPSILSGIETTPHVFKTNDPYTPTTPITSTLIVTDFDSTMLTGTTISITPSTYVRGQDQLVIDGSAIPKDKFGTPKLSVAWNSTAGVLTISGTATLDVYRDVLRAVSYINTSPTPNTATRTIRFQVTDDTRLNSNIVTRDVAIYTSNTAPFLSINSGGPLAFTEKDPVTPVAPSLTIVDADSPNMKSAAVKITGNYQSGIGLDRLVFMNTPRIMGAWVLETGTLTLTGVDTIDNYQTALRSVGFVNNNNNPSTATRTVSFTVSDGLATSNVATRDITVQAVNDAPVVATNAPGALAYSPANGSVFVAPALTVTDADSDNLTFATVQISFNYQRGNDQLTFMNTGKITGSFDVGSGILTLTGTDSVSNYRTALQSVKYAYIGNAISSMKKISFVASDGIALSTTPAVRDIAVSP